ncbi:MAG: 2-oxoacid:acceptor oxidoreductase family protein [Planctomycetales bacterium]
MESSAANGIPLTIQIVGLGGQGVVLAGDILAEAALLADFNVKKSEIHGLSRRYGSVSCQVRIGDQLHSPLCGHGNVDLLLAFEGYEGLKHLPFLAEQGTGLFNRLWRKPNVHSATADQPPEMQPDPRLTWFDGTDVTLRAKCLKSLNFFMLGVISTRLAIPEDIWEETMLTLTKAATQGANWQMFKAGRRIASPEPISHAPKMIPLHNPPHFQHDVFQNDGVTVLPKVQKVVS